MTGPHVNPGEPAEPSTTLGPPYAPRRRSPLIPALVAGLALVLAGVMFGMTRDGDDRPPVAVVTPSGTASGSPTSLSPEQARARSMASSVSADLARRRDGDPLARGKRDAPVLMIEFSEFQCPFCGKYAREVEPQLARYVDDGTLRIEWRDFPYLGKESTTVAVAARAAAAQDKFWAFHDAWFAEQPPPNSGKATPAYLEQVAVKAGLDAARFRTDLADAKGELAKAVRADLDQAHQLGIGGTPAFIINGSVIMGAQPVEEFVKAIEHEARLARGG